MFRMLLVRGGPRIGNRRPASRVPAPLITVISSEPSRSALHTDRDVTCYTKYFLPRDS